MSNTSPCWCCWLAWPSPWRCCRTGSANGSGSRHRRSSCSLPRSLPTWCRPWGSCRSPPSSGWCRWPWSSSCLTAECIGWRRFRTAAGPVVWVGVAGTFVTAAALATLAHALFDLDWRAALLVGTALAPTDPAVVFSVLGRRKVAGRSGTILEGESGANDPVGIALLASLLAAGQSAGLDTAGSVAGTFLLQLAVGAAVGVAGGALLVRFMRRLPLPSEGLYPLRVLAGALVIYGAATVAHGSGFLAVFIAGILVGDARAPYKGGDRTVPRCPGQPGRDRGLPRARPHRRPAHPARQLRLGYRP